VEAASDWYHLQNSIGDGDRYKMTWHRFIVFANEPITIAVVVTVGGGCFLQQILREQDQKRARRELGEALVVEMTGLWHLSPTSESIPQYRRVI
jgi:hypothetical protein